MLFYEKYIASTAAAHAAKLCGPDPLPHAAQHLGGGRGGKGAQFPERRITMGMSDHCGGAEKFQQCYKYSFNTVNLLPKKLRFEYGGAPNLLLAPDTI